MMKLVKTGVDGHAVTEEEEDGNEAEAVALMIHGSRVLKLIAWTRHPDTACGDSLGLRPLLRLRRSSRPSGPPLMV